MSVINQMLRDLDQQATLAGLPLRTSGALGDLTFDPQLVRPPVGVHRLLWPRWRVVGTFSAFVIVAWGGVWLQEKQSGTSIAVGVVNTVNAVQLPLPPQRPQPEVVAAVVVPPEMAAETLPVSPPVLVKSPMLQRVPVALKPAQTKPVAAAEPSLPPVAPQLAQGLETPQTEQAVLAQAQSMWRSGMQVAAVELLNQAVVAAEREQPGWSALAQSDRLAILVRELARMQLSMGQVSLTMDMLVRLTPALSGYPDIWAIRGNVAQRLGLHQASVDAYAMALKVRPDEPRWLLGTSVSLASLGQLKVAAEMAEKARDQGQVSPAVMAYLEQLGVTLLPR